MAQVYVFLSTEFTYVVGSASMGDTSSLYCCVDGEGYWAWTFPCWLLALVGILLSSVVTRRNL